PQRIPWELLPESLRTDVDNYLSWAGTLDPFAEDARPRPLKATTLRLRRDQIHAAVTALVKSGIDPADIRSLADFVTSANLKNILRRRLAMAGDQENNFNVDLATM